MAPVGMEMCESVNLQAGWIVATMKINRPVAKKTGVFGQTLLRWFSAIEEQYRQSGILLVNNPEYRSHVYEPSK
jgi:hypothetical protein